MDDLIIEEERKKQRAERLNEMKRRKRQQERLRKNMKRYGIIVAAAAAVCVIVIFVVVKLMTADSAPEAEQETVETAETVSQPEDEQEMTQEEETQPETETEEELTGMREPSEEATSFFPGYEVAFDGTEGGFDEEKMVSSEAILLDMQTGEVIAQKGAQERINPASMTKILTVLVAAEHITDLDDTVTITIDVTDYAYQHDCSTAGFLENEVVTVRDLFYGTILPSGGDAAAALAVYVAGDLDSFADMMNQKLAELGLSETAHFTNCIGLYDENHYCTVNDMAMILKAAVENELCREVLSAHTYTTSATEQHPEGIILSNWFLRRIEDKDTHGEVLCAKTGFVNQSGSCAASFAVSEDGKYYICVTVNAYSSWRCIYDHVEIYQEYLYSAS